MDNFTTTDNSVCISSVSSSRAFLDTETVLSYIDGIKTVYTVNMFELCPQLEAQFSLTHDEAKHYIVLWLRHFSARFLKAKHSSSF